MPVGLLPAEPSPTGIIKELRRRLGGADGLGTGPVPGAERVRVMVWSGTPIRDTSCCFHPLTGVPCLRVWTTQVPVPEVSGVPEPNVVPNFLAGPPTTPPPARTPPALHRQGFTLTGPNVVIYFKIK